MQYNQLGNTGLLVSQLCFGTMTFGGHGFWQVVGTQQQAEANELVARAIGAGINFFDTANAYSAGESERILGKALEGKRQEVVVATKVYGRMAAGVNKIGLSRVNIMNEVHASLQRLGTDYIDLYQVHAFDGLTPVEEVLRTLDDLVRSGKVRYIGCSNWAAWQIMKAHGVSALQHGVRFESLQAYYTIAGRDLEREIAPMLRDQRMGLLVWSPLAGGFLSGKFQREEAGPTDARRASFDFPPINKERAFNVIDVMRTIANNKGVSVAQIALAWLLHQDIVTSVIIGAKRVDQLDDNLASTQVKFSADEMKELNEVSALPMEYPGWMLARQSADRRPTG